MVDSVLQPERSQRRLRLEPGLGMVLQGEGELGPQGLSKEERRGVLREIADRLGDIGGVQTCRVLPRDEHPAGGWPVQTSDEPQQRRLARSISPHERDQLPGRTSRSMSRSTG